MGVEIAQMTAQFLRVLCLPLVAAYVAAQYSGSQSTTDSVMQRSSHQVTNSAGFTHVGCFKDDPSDRDLPVQKSDDPHMTPDQCNTQCAGYSYFAIQISRCWCGNSYGKHGIAQSQYSGLKNMDNLDYAPGCNHDCYGLSAGFPCGGVHRNSVYHRPPTMNSDCGSNDEVSGLLRSNNVCKPDQGELAGGHYGEMPPGTLWVDPGHSESDYSHPGVYEHASQTCPGQHNCYRSGGNLGEAAGPSGTVNQIWSAEQSHQVN